MTFVPPFPIYPPETAWMREPKTDLPGLILNSPARAGRRPVDEFISVGPLEVRVKLPGDVRTAADR